MTGVIPGRQPRILALTEAKAFVPELQNFSAEYVDPHPQALEMLRVLYCQFRDVWMCSDPGDGIRDIVLCAYPHGVPLTDGSTAPQHYIIRTSQASGPAWYPTPLANELGHELTHLFISPRRTHWLIETFCDGFSQLAADHFCREGWEGCDPGLWLSEKSAGFSPSAVGDAERLQMLRREERRYYWGSTLMSVLKKNEIPPGVARGLATFTSKPLLRLGADATDVGCSRAEPAVADWIASLDIRDEQRTILASFFGTAN